MDEVDEMDRIGSFPSRLVFNMMLSSAVVKCLARLDSRLRGNDAPLARGLAGTPAVQKGGTPGLLTGGVNCCGDRWRPPVLLMGLLPPSRRKINKNPFLAFLRG